MQKKIFLTQQVLDQWSTAAKITIEGNIITIPSKGNSRYTLRPAVKFIAIESRGDDPNNLVGKVILSDLLKEKGVDVYMNSAIHRDDAYMVEEGFVGLFLEESGKEDKSIEHCANSGNAKSDDELLADFLLKSL